LTADYKIGGGKNMTIGKMCGVLLVLSVITVIASGTAQLAHFDYPQLTWGAWIAGWFGLATGMITWIVSSALKDLKDNRARDYWD